MDKPSPLLTIADWQRAYRAGAEPAVLLAAQLARLAARGRPVYLHVADAGALASQCARLQSLAAAHPDRETLLAAHPLWGVPFVVKDNIDIGGTPTTAACPAFAYDAERDAAVVRRLCAAGAVWLAKTNLDQFATGLVGTRSPYGAPASSWSARHVSGGSSSGSAVAVAVGDVPFALGTDTAGSGRIPAAFNHLVGLKPTPGRVPNSGVLPACRSLDCVSIFALTVDDAAAVLATMEGVDADDAFSRTVAGPAALPGTLRIGVPTPMPAAVGTDEHAAMDTLLARLTAQGHSAVPVDFAPLLAVAALLYDGPWVAERHLVIDALLRSQPGAVDPQVRQIIRAAEGFTADDAFRGRYHLQALAREAEAIWDKVDVLLVPTAPGHPTLDDLAREPIAANAALGLFTNFVNLLGWSALALPAAVSPTGLPLGVTLIGRGGHDVALARLGRHCQALAAQPMGATGRPYQPDPPTGPQPLVEACLPVAVVGAHLSGLPLNHQLTELGATLLEATQTAPSYRLYALPGTTPRKPGLMRVADGGQAIALEIWALPLHHVGRFLAGIPAPLGLGSVTLSDGRSVHGFVCEALAVQHAQDVSHHGGWRAYLATL